MNTRKSSRKFLSTISDALNNFHLKLKTLRWTIIQVSSGLSMALNTTRETSHLIIHINISNSQIAAISQVYSTVCSGADQRKHQSSASLAFVRRIYRWLLNSPHRGPVTRKMFPFYDVNMYAIFITNFSSLVMCNTITLSLFHRLIESESTITFNELQ